MEARSVIRCPALSDEELLGDARVCVAVLDGPVDLSHPCFAGADLTRLDTLVQEPAGQGPMSLHGTHVASLLFGQPGSTVVGVAPRCRGLIIPVFRDAREGRVPQLDLARAIEQAVQEGAHIINISGGERTPDTQAESLLSRALRLCDDSGVLVVSAVGNDGCDCLQVPAAVSSVLAVGASGTDGTPLKINNWAAVYRENGVLAPGQDIEGAVPGGGRRAMTGSSFATPAVSGAAALLVATQLREGRKADPKAVRRALVDSAWAPPCAPGDSPGCRRYLAGHMDVAGAHRLITEADRTPAGRVADAAPSPAAAQDTGELSPATGVNAAGGPAVSGAPDTESSEGAGAMDANDVPVTTGQDADAPPEPPPGGAGEQDPAAPGDPAAQEWQASAAEQEGSATGEPSSQTPDSGARQGADAMEPHEMPQTAAGGTAQAGRAVESAPAQTGPPERAGAAHAGVQAACGGGTGASCGCGGGGARPLIYAIGTIGFDFRTEARRDTFRQLMPWTEGRPGPKGEPSFVQPNIYNPTQLSAYLSANPWESDKLTWTLELDRTPIYALEAEAPVGMNWGGTVPPDPAEAKAKAKAATTDPDALAQLLMERSYPPVSTVYKVFREAIAGQARLPGDEDVVSRVSIPGRLTDRTTRLFSGQVVPVVEVMSRGLATWNETALVKAVVDGVTSDHRNEATTNQQDLEKTIRALLDKIYYQFRNLGQSSADRALNYAGTNAFQFGNQVKEGLLSASYVPGSSMNLYSLDTVRVSKSPYCRIGSDCQDVVVTFLDPEDDRRAKVNYLFTIDVSDIPPVSLAPVHTFLGDM
ncbi:S8 family serine peptidase [Streptomyces sp. NPDC050161]|uniref:cyanobactin maturation protease PatG family protein n=1 Tax=Streptomyces sp. NPDC050161 TaxID=3365604 RepID=UPI0037B383EB